MRKRKKSKQIYHLRNWHQYNAALVQRGSLTVWIAEDTLARWQNPPHIGRRGRPFLYTDLAIQCMATLEAIYHLPLRATEGLLVSVLKLMGVTLPVPDYTTLCRRRKRLSVRLPRRARRGPLHLVVDSSGVKIFGEGEWKVRCHRASKRRTWRKLHIGVDETTHELVAAVVTTNDVAELGSFDMECERINLERGSSLYQGGPSGAPGCEGS